MITERSSPCDVNSVDSLAFRPAQNTDNAVAEPDMSPVSNYTRSGERHLSDNGNHSVCQRFNTTTSSQQQSASAVEVCAFAVAVRLVHGSEIQ